MHKSNIWWDNIVLSSFTDQDWLNNFRISRQAFLYLCDKLSSRLQRQDIVMRCCISVQKHVAITLWCLVTPAKYRTVGHVFGVSRSSVRENVHETYLVIVIVLLKTYIKFPTGDNIDNVVREFKAKWGVPLGFGIIDETYIPVSVPSENYTDYYNRKGWYSMIIQGLVDASYCFLDLCVGWPGSVYDARVFVCSSLYKKITDNQFIPDKTKSIGSVDVPLYMIGDSAYPLQSWLISLLLIAVMLQHSNTHTITE